MLFKKKICDHCGSNYDVVLPTCPACNTPDGQYAERKIRQQISWLPTHIQLILFGIGSIGLTIASLILSIVLLLFLKEDSFTYSAWLNITTYLVVFAGIIAFLSPHLKSILKKFAKLEPYLIGVLGGIALIAANIGYSYLINAIHPTTDNDNQQMAVQMVNNLPVMSVIVLGIVGPIVEECTYRLGLFSFGVRVNRLVSYIVTSCIFAIIHFNPVSEDIINELLNLPSYLIAGLLLCHTYDEAGLPASITAHIINNIFSIILISMGQ